ncbi:hypothetical protein ACMYYO_06125 [Dermacoccaceae bacterium W4C1]
MPTSDVVPDSSPIAHLDLIMTSPVLARSLEAEAKRREDVQLGLSVFSWLDFTRAWDFDRSHVLLDGFLDDHVPLPLKLRALRRLGAHPLVLAPSVAGGVGARTRAEGGSGWITPDHSCAEIIDAVRKPPWEVAERPLLGADLTDREIQVLVLYTSRRAFSPRRLARVMGVGEETIRAHLRRGRAKYAALGVRVDSRERLSQALNQDGYLISDEDWRRQGRW